MNAKFIAAIAMATLTLVACKKDDTVEPTAPVPTPTTGSVALSVGFVKGMQPFDINAAHTDGAGNNIRFTTLKFYVSGASASNDDGVTVGAFNSTYILVDAAQPDQNTFALGSMNAGHIHELHFTLGLDDSTNRTDPTLAAYPLNIPGMHWSWNPSAGYKFMNMEGYVDVNNNGTFEDGTDVSFQYHCAQNEAQAANAPVLREGFIDVHMDLMAGSALTVEAKVDVEALLAGVDLLSVPVAMGNFAGNQLLMDNLVTAISGQ
jgi:hypothetical protein